MPGARSLPADSLVKCGFLLPPDDLERAFDSAKVPLASSSAKVTLTCGSGVTAATVALALAVLGRDDAAVYDGSWTEWGDESLDTLVVKGPAGV